MRPFALIILSTLIAAVALPADDAGRIVYNKSFSGSTPPWVEITLDRSGAAVYKEDPKDDNPVTFDLLADEVRQVFGLADKLDHFSHPLESRLKVANMGLKTFRYEDGQAPHEVKFNYTENIDARALNDWFEQMIDTERAFIDLERSVHYDKLGVQDALLRIETLRDLKRLVAPPQFLTLLDRVAGNESFLHMARERAAALAEKIRGQRGDK